MEVHLSAFETFFNSIDGQEKNKLYLHTSPEFSMKKLLSYGLKNIYQFTHTFRNEIVSNTHYPEFLMLEWYRTDVNYDKLVEDCKRILEISLSLTENKFFKYRDKICYPEIEKLTIQNAFLKYCNFDIFKTIDNQFKPTPKLITPFATKLGISVSISDTWDDIFEKLMLEFIEPNLGVDKATILYEYPIHQAVLSKAKPENPNISERFEFYICGVEIANAFTELNDREIQEKRFLTDQAEKQRIYNTTFPIDYEFLNSVENLPLCAGIALGVDRLVMVATHIDDIKDLLWTEIPTI